MWEYMWQQWLQLEMTMAADAAKLYAYTEACTQHTHSYVQRDTCKVLVLVLKMYHIACQSGSCSTTWD
jgi:hypothetical protein